MPVLVSEALVFRTYPFRESDSIVSFFTRDQGKLRGTARRARKLKSEFGSGLERLSWIKMHYTQRETRELVNLNRCDLIQSNFSIAGDYAGCVALDFIAEVSDGLLPPGEPNERFFRLLLAVLEHLRTRPEEGIWPSVTYFSLWAVRLSGFLPALSVSAESRAIAEEMLRTAIGQLARRSWTSATAGDLRRFLIRAMQDQVERKLYSPPLLEAL